MTGAAEFVPVCRSCYEQGPAPGRPVRLLCRDGRYAHRWQPCHRCGRYTPWVCSACTIAKTLGTARDVHERPRLPAAQVHGRVFRCLVCGAEVPRLQRLIEHSLIVHRRILAADERRPVTPVGVS